ncbi:MAG: hypothetical protein CMP23_04880 [Rickettsiales bacterium]|nr:hypothetical protein [Rickettsiales bacterium]|tara:strand:+ start:1755 stop:2078 length:324 start_codon:yes stop_codon:yes gene_type:complete
MARSVKQRVLLIGLYGSVFSMLDPVVARSLSFASLRWRTEAAGFDLLGRRIEGAFLSLEGLGVQGRFFTSSWIHRRFATLLSSACSAPPARRFRWPVARSWWFLWLA